MSSKHINVPYAINIRFVSYRPIDQIHQMAFANQQSTTIRRLQAELREICIQPSPDFVAGPVGDDLFIWHFTIKGPKDSAFEGGIYHGKITFPQQYPLKPPDIYFLTPNGRFETRKKICLTMTSFHPDQWSAAWGVRTILTSLTAFMQTKAEGAVGAIDEPDHERRALAIQSRNWKCTECELKLQPDPIPGEHTEEECHCGHHEEETVTEDTGRSDELVEQDVVVEEQEEHQIGEVDTREGDIEYVESDDKTEPVDEVKESAVDDGIKHYDFGEMRTVSLKKKDSFVPLLDIPIIVLLLLLMFLIANNAFHFVDIFGKAK